MNVEVTDACNLRCPGCHRPIEGTAFMDLPTFRLIGERLRDAGREQIGLFWRGESCLHPNLPEMAEASKGLGFKRVRVSTNAAVPFLHDVNYVSKLLSHLDEMVVCVDGYDQPTLERYRVGASWDMTQKNVEAIGKVETGCIREMRVLMFKYNDGHEDFYRKLAKENNFDYVVFVSPIINGVIISDADVEAWMSTNPRFQRYEKAGEKVWRIKREETCMARPIVAVNGNLHPCCIDWNLSYPLGSVIVKPLAHIVEGAYRQLRPSLSRRELPMCKDWCCTPMEPAVFRENV